MAAGDADGAAGGVEAVGERGTEGDAGDRAEIDVDRARRAGAVDGDHDRLVAEQTASPKATVVGTITLIYDHHAHGVSEKLTELQHAHYNLVVSTSHAHLDHDSCLEVLIVHGEAREVEQFAGRLIGLKGVQHGKLVMSVAQPAGDAGRGKHSHPHKH